MSKQVLYRRYRSLVFEEVLGEKHVTDTLKKAVANDRVGHAYLFSGPRGIGKTSVARILARAVNCTNKKEGGDPCNECTVCNSFLKQSSMDLIEVDAASHRGIDDVRFLQEGVSFAPVEARLKIFIIDEVHMLSKEAFNALLKTLEEPPQHALFILATTELHKVPDTIISRCQHFRFVRIGENDIAQYLVELAGKEGYVLQKEAARLIAENVTGGMRDALSALQQLVIGEEKEISLKQVEEILGLVEEEIMAEIIKKMIKGEIADVLNYYYDQVYTKGIDGQRFMRSLEKYVRKLLLIKNGVKQGEGKIDLDLLMQVSNDKLVFWLELIQDLRKKEFEIDALYFELFIYKSKPVSSLASNQGHQVIVDKKKVESVEKELITDKEEVKNIKVEEVSRNKNVGAAIIDQAVDLDLEMIKKKWHDFVNKVIEQKPSIGSILKMASLEGLSQGQLNIAVAKQFYRDQLMHGANYCILTDKFQETCGAKVNFICEVKDLAINDISSSAQWSQEEIDSKVQSVTAVFGGKVINS